MGEMERDALLSHGVAFCLHDRLMLSSDCHVASVCGKCGALLGVQPKSPTSFTQAQSGGGGGMAVKRHNESNQVNFIYIALNPF